MLINPLSLLFVVVTFCTLMPFVSVVISFPSQMQPWAALFSMIGGFVFFLMKKNKLSFEIKSLIIFSLMLSMYITKYSVIDIEYFKKNIGLVFSISILIFYYYYGYRSEFSRVILPVLYLYLFFAVLQYLSTPIYTGLSGLFLDVSDIHIGERGAASLMPEATDFGFTLNYFILITYLFYKQGVASGGLLKHVIILCVLMIFLSKSASGVITLVLLLFAIYCVNARIKLGHILASSAAIGLVMILMFVFSNELMNIRGFVIIVDLLNDYETIMLTSFAHRFIHNAVGFLAFIDSNLLGFGAGTWSFMAEEVFQIHRLDIVFSLNPYYSIAVADSLNQAPLSNIGFMLLEYGVFGLIFVYLIFYKLTKIETKLYIPALCIMLLTWLQSFPLAFPPFWMVIGLLMHAKNNK